MKTITEFQAIQIKNADKVKQELTASGKTPEELPQAMGETLKIEGDKLTFIMNALELNYHKNQDLKRVLVMTLNEGEKAPSGAQQKGEHHYLVEYYPPLRGAAPTQRGHGRGDRDQKRGRGGRGGRSGRGGGKDGKPRGDRPRGPRPPKAPTQNTAEKKPE